MSVAEPARAGEAHNVGRSRVAVIVGAGLAGTLLAIYLARLGFRVRVFERRGDPRAKGYIGGRSINLALSARGLWGLQGVGLDSVVMTEALPMRGRMMHPPVANPTLVFQPYSARPTDAINSISRSGLNLTLLNAAAKEPGVEVVFDHRCLDIDPDTCVCTFANDADSGSEVRVQADLIVGADGAFSPVRGRLMKTDRFEYSQTYLGHGYKELHIPPAPAGSPEAAKFNGYAMDPSALHIWPRGGSMMIALPNPDKSFTCTLFWPFDGPGGFSSLSTREHVRSFFLKHYPDAVPLMPTLEDDYLANPVSSLVTVRCWPWTRVNAAGQGVALAGDAAHAIVPFFGQGMNAAFEDVRVLAECLSRHHGDLRAALDDYQHLRKPNADAIARMALDNFVEMRDKVGSRAFLYRKKLEHALHDLAPEYFAPKYNLVSFSTVPYVEALRRGARLDRLVRIVALVLTLMLSLVLLAILPRIAGLLLLVLLVVAWVWWDRAAFTKDTRA